MPARAAQSPRRELPPWAACGRAQVPLIDCFQPLLVLACPVFALNYHSQGLRPIMFPATCWKRSSEQSNPTDAYWDFQGVARCLYSVPRDPSTSPGAYSALQVPSAPPVFSLKYRKIDSKKSEKRWQVPSFPPTRTLQLSWHPRGATLDFAKMILFLFSTSTIIQLQEI